jgi:hypothetical protein
VRRRSEDFGPSHAPGTGGGCARATAACGGRTPRLREHWSLVRRGSYRRRRTRVSPLKLDCLLAEEGVLPSAWPFSPSGLARPLPCRRTERIPLSSSERDRLGGEQAAEPERSPCGSGRARPHEAPQLEGRCTNDESDLMTRQTAKTLESSACAATHLLPASSAWASPPISRGGEKSLSADRRTQDVRQTGDRITAQAQAMRSRPLFGAVQAGPCCCLSASGSLITPSPLDYRRKKDRCYKGCRSPLKSSSAPSRSTGGRGAWPGPGHGSCVPMKGLMTRHPCRSLQKDDGSQEGQRPEPEVSNRCPDDALGSQ